VEQSTAKSAHSPLETSSETASGVRTSNGDVFLSSTLRYTIELIWKSIMKGKNKIKITFKVQKIPAHH
jgi:hypothetical protein